VADTIDSMAAPPRFGVGLRILVVDDEPAVLDFMTEALASWGFFVETAADCKAAHARAAGSTFDLLLVDKNLPDGNGLDLVRDLGGRQGDCTAMIMSGFANLSSALEAIRDQVAEYFVKPFDLRDFEARLRRVVEHLALGRRNRELVSELRRKNELLEYLATRDVVTALFNHAHFQDAVQGELVRSARGRRYFALLLLDVDGFRHVNDAAGHARGDAVLTEVGRVLESQRRASDLAARYEKDAFALLLPETAKASANAKAEILRQALAEHDFGLPDGRRLTVAAGVAAYPDDGATRDELITAAQLSLAAAKSAGGNCVMTYQRQLVGVGGIQPDAVRRELERHAAVERAIASRTFDLVYQPIVEIASREILGYEALCRPAAADFGSPVELFAAAERSGRVAALGRIVRERSVAPAGALPRAALLFLNIHPHELFHAAALEHEPALRPLAPRLVLEITEGAHLDDAERAHARILELRAVGFRVAVDDLGSGWASLNRLARLAPDFVKLDMDLVRDLRPGSRAARLIARVVDFCRDEGVRPIAEGVETEDELRTVADLGVTLAQGFLLGYPGPPPGAQGA
jgi:diguanylate cyclase (GGDEF)-like protein